MFGGYVSSLEGMLPMGLDLNIYVTCIIINFFQPHVGHFVHITWNICEYTSDKLLGVQQRSMYGAFTYIWLNLYGK